MLQEIEDVCETSQHVLMSLQLHSGPRIKTLITDLFHTIISYTAHINKTNCIPGKQMQCDMELRMLRHVQTFGLARWHKLLSDLIKCDFSQFILKQTGKTGASCHIGYHILQPVYHFGSKV